MGVSLPNSSQWQANEAFGCWSHSKTKNFTWGSFSLVWDRPGHTTGHTLHRAYAHRIDLLATDTAEPSRHRQDPIMTLSPHLIQGDPVPSREPACPILLAVCDKPHIRVTSSLEKHKEETGRRSENSTYCAGEKHVSLVFKSVSTSFFPFTPGELLLPSMLKNPFFW